jgi:hypothetical protein
MCTYCKPNGWNQKACNFCGIHGDGVYISISIRLKDDSDYPYTVTDLCRKCWDIGGIEAAMQHNRDIQHIINGTP